MEGKGWEGSGGVKASNPIRQDHKQSTGDAARKQQVQIVRVRKVILGPESSSNTEPNDPEHLNGSFWVSKEWTNFFFFSSSLGGWGHEILFKLLTLSPEECIHTYLLSPEVSEDLQIFWNVSSDPPLQMIPQMLRKGMKFKFWSEMLSSPSNPFTKLQPEWSFKMANQIMSPLLKPLQGCPLLSIQKKSSTCHSLSHPPLPATCPRILAILTLIALVLNIPSFLRAFAHALFSS